MMAQTPTHQVRKNTLAWILFIVALTIPTVIASVYYFLIASNVYASQSKLSVYSKDVISTVNIASQLGITGENSKSQDLLILKEFIFSKDILDRLQKDINIKAMYQNEKADFLERLPKDASEKQFLDYYRTHINIEIFREASLMTLETKAARPEDAKKINETILAYAEEFINNLSARIKFDSQVQAQTIVDDVEKEIVELKNKLSDLRQNKKVFNPRIEVETDLSIIGKLEEKRAQLIAEKNILLATYKPESYLVKAADKKIANITAQLSAEKKRLLREDGQNADTNEQFQVLEMEEQFTAKKYELALFNLEETYRNMQNQNKYVITVLAPTFPSYAVEPRRLMGVISVLVSAFLTISISALVVAGIRDHMI